MPKTDGARVVADLKRLAEFGRYKSGVHRPTYSPDDVASRHWLADRFAEAGLVPAIDGIGNVFGRNERARRHLLVGSHSETQPYGGWLDGALGVIYALEVARAFAADPDCAGLGIDAVAWADEEGHYGQMLGSRSFTGAIGEDELAACKSRDGVPLADALRTAGFADRARAEVDPARYIGYLEAHIEQGDTLDSTGLRIGSSRRSSASATTGSASSASRTMPARPRWRDARMPAWRWCGSRPAFTTVSPSSPARARCGRSGA